MESTKQKVVITGITGYIASQVCKVFLEDGTYSVRGTVRDKNNQTKLAALQKAYGTLFNLLEIVEADLLDPESLSNAVKGCDYVMHIASPNPITEPKEESDIIRPALEGTLSILKAAQEFKVKRVVVTSNCLAIIRKKPENIKAVYDENDWSDMEVISYNDKSKTVAEKAAWEYHASLPKTDRFELVTVLPSLVMGPSLINWDFDSGKLMRDIFIGEMPSMPNNQVPLVDVRDVAFAHLQALKVKEAMDQRIIVCNKCVWFSEIAETLKGHFGKNCKVNTGQMSYFTAKIVGVFIKKLRLMIPMWGKEFSLVNDKSKNILGVQYTDVNKTIIEMAENLIELDLI